MSYVRERWEFEGYIGKKKFSGYVGLENGVLYECGIAVKDYEPEFQRHDIDCNGVVFESVSDVFSACFDLVLNTLELMLRNGDVAEVRIGKKEVYISRTPTTTPLPNENDNNDSLIDLFLLY